MHVGSHLKRYSLLILSIASVAGCSHPAQNAANTTLVVPPTTGAGAGSAPDSSPVSAPTPPATQPSVKPNTPAGGSGVLPVSPKSFEGGVSGTKAKINDATQIPATGTEEWTASTQSATELAKDVEKSMASQQNLLADVNVAVEDPDGNNATGGAQVKIENDKTFHVPFVGLKTGITSNSIVSNGKEKMEQLGDAWQPKVPADKPLNDSISDPTKLAVNFDKDFMRLVFQPITDHVNVWDSTVGAWEKGVGNYKVSVEQRQLSWDAPANRTDAAPDHKYHIKQYRIHAIRDGQAALMQGRSEVEIVVDDMHKMPVTIRSTYSTPDGKKLWKVEWGAQYHWRQRFKAADFTAPWDMKRRKSGGVPTAVAN